MYRLAFLNGKFKGRRLAIQQGSILIGRDTECHVRLTDDDEVSRKHARIEERDEGVFIADAGSLNKILINDREIREGQLRQNDVVQLGNTRIQFIEYSAGLPQERRQVGHVQRLTFAAVLLVVILELGFLVGLSVWHRATFSEKAAQAILQATNEAEEASASPAPPLDPEQARQQEEANAKLKRYERWLEQEAAAPAEVPEQTADLSNEVKQIQQDLAGLRDQIEGLTGDPLAAATPDPATSPRAATAPAAPVSPPPEVPSALAEDPLVARARSMLKDALAEEKRHNLIQADYNLERIQVMAPDFLPAYVERARLFESRGLLGKAGEQWTQVMNRSAGSPLYPQAAAERTRIAHAEAIQKNVKPPPAPAGGADRQPRRITLASVEPQKFPASAQYDEMRILRVTLKIRSGENPMAGDDIAVIVRFFDQEKESGQIRLTGATAPQEALTISGLVNGGAQQTLSATYVIPKGFRAKEKMARGEESRFYGYLVRVFYKDALQDEEARPPSLLKQGLETPSSLLKSGAQNLPTQ